MHDFRAEVTCLRSQVVSKVTASSQIVFNQQRDLVGEAELDRLGETSGLAELDQVFQGEGQGNGFGELDVDVQLGLVNIGMAS